MPVPVLREEGYVIASELMGSPNEWILCGTGTYDKKRAFEHTIGSIRRGTRVGFRYRDRPEGLIGRFEVKMLSDRSPEARESRSADVELWIRWVPNAEQ